MYENNRGQMLDDVETRRPRRRAGALPRRPQPRPVRLRHRAGPSTWPILRSRITAVHDAAVGGAATVGRTS
ncbi:hypothetical protein ACU686_19140 [Yinghuangia aomiensis]